MSTKELFANLVSAIIQGDEAAAKDALHQAAVIKVRSQMEPETVAAIPVTPAEPEPAQEPAPAEPAPEV